MSRGSELINNYFTKAQAAKHVKGVPGKPYFGQWLYIAKHKFSQCNLTTQIERVQDKYISSTACVRKQLNEIDF